MTAPDDQVTGLGRAYANKARLTAIEVRGFYIRIRKAGEVVNIVYQVRAIGLGTFTVQRMMVIGDGINNCEALVASYETICFAVIFLGGRGTQRTERQRSRYR